MKIALDAGHGEDTYERTGGRKGVLRDGTVFEEYTFNSAVIAILKELLEYNNFYVRLTQPINQKEVPLKERTDLANKEDVDLFWSVHANASGGASVRGACCFYWHSSKEGKQLAKLFSKEMSAAGITLHGDGMHAAVPGTWTNLHVVRETKMVAILTENGFMTNPDDLNLLQSGEYQRKVAEIHGKIICEFFGVPFKNIKEDGYPAVTPEWKKEAVEWLFKEGLLTGQEWKNKIDKPLPLWAEAIILKRLLKQIDK